MDLNEHEKVNNREPTEIHDVIENRPAEPAAGPLELASTGNHTLHEQHNKRRQRGKHVNKYVGVVPNHAVATDAAEN